MLIKLVYLKVIDKLRKELAIVRKSFRDIIRDIIYKNIPLPYVFMFHHISNNCETNKIPCSIEFDEFKKIILDFDGCYTSITDIVENKKKGKVAITFDDGYEDLYTLAYPFLKKQGIPFTAFIVTDFLDKEGYITTEQLKEMSLDPLVTIGSHGTTHTVLRGLDMENKKKELIVSQEFLSTVTNTPVKYFAYSHGQYDEECFLLMNGYDAAFSASICLSQFFKWNRYLIPRFNITSETIEKQLAFFRKVPLKKNKTNNRNTI